MRQKHTLPQNIIYKSIVKPLNATKTHLIKTNIDHLSQIKYNTGKVMRQKHTHFLRARSSSATNAHLITMEKEKWKTN